MTARRAAIAALVLLGVWLASGRVEATSSCTVSTTGVLFGTYNVFDSTSKDSTGSVTYRCTYSPSQVRIDISTGSSNSYAQRTMRNGTQVLNYNLYRDAARSLVWGTHSPLIASCTTVVTIYGRVPAQQDVGAGTYSDTLVVTLDF
jgi:spore coat protein U domain-containing protein, fimbrial subunit CupE1/2/3/6